MNPEKSRLKISTINEVGNKFDDMRDGIIREISEWVGAKQALKEAAKNVQNLAAHVDKDLEEDLVPGDALPVAAYVKKYIGRAVEAVDNMMLRAQNLELVANGKLTAMDGVLKCTKKVYDEEMKALELYKKAVEAGVPPGEVGRPDNAGNGDKTVSAAAEIQERRDAAKKVKEEAKITKKTKKTTTRKRRSGAKNAR